MAPDAYTYTLIASPREACVAFTVTAVADRMTRGLYKVDERAWHYSNSVSNNGAPAFRK